MTFTPRIGVYICHCGINIAGTVDVSVLVHLAGRLPGVVVARDYAYMCSDPGQALIRQDIEALQLNRIVVASCSPRMHEPTFRAVLASAGLNPYCLEMANLREQCAWVHPHAPETTHKAMALVAAAAARAARLEPLQERQVPVTPRALVIGGGVAGLQAALDVADAGFDATLVEQSSELGGQAARLHRTFPNLEPAGSQVDELVERVRQAPRIQVLTEAQVEAVDGYVGNFRARVRQARAETEVEAGTVIIATGFEPFDARLRPELGYGAYPQVITTLDFERRALAGGLGQPRSVVFIQCVGSRDRTVGNPYCSRVCCMAVARQARWVREQLPQARVTVFYMDVRAFGKGFETFYDEARESGILYRRGSPAEVRRAPGRPERVVVRAEDTLLGEAVEVEADLVVLAVGMTPRRDTGRLAGLLKLARSPDGFFMEAHPKLRPVDTTVAGVFLAGCCQAPKDMTDAISQARAAAAAALVPLLRGRMPVEAATSSVDERLCAGCGQCAQVCAFGALALHPVRGVMSVNPVLCQGCGACAAACPSGAIGVRHFTFGQVLAQVEALSDGNGG